MQFTRIHIKNFKSIRDLELGDIDNAMILVGKNNTGKTSILDAVRAVTGSYVIGETDFNEAGHNVEIEVMLSITQEDRKLLHQVGAVSRYKRYEVWERDFYKKLPSLQDDVLTFTFTANRDGKKRFSDGVKKDNSYIPMVLPKLYYIDTGRGLEEFQDALFFGGDNRLMEQMRRGSCLFDSAKACRHCFQCIGLINQKKPEELNAYEAEKLMEYKLYQLGMGGLVERINDNFRKNGGYEDILYEIGGNMDQIFHVNVEIYNGEQGKRRPIEYMSRGMRSIYMLSLLETYIEDEDRLPSVVLVEYPELFLHPKLQKVAGEILYRLSKKNQVIFDTHAPQLLMNFTEKQIRQVLLNRNYDPIIRERADIGAILDDLGYNAADILNVDFVFIVEGKQDKSRLPLLLNRYYSDLHNEGGELSRIAIISTNSCTNIKTYANLKYMNQIYLKDHFLMIRDGDGKDPEELADSLCRYYAGQNETDADRLPRVGRENVLILKYYSFENYFLNPIIMAKLNIIKSEEEFYDILWGRWQEYLYRLKSGVKFTEVIGHHLQSKEDLKDHMEAFKIHMRGHNLFDIFYGKFKKQESEILGKYIELAPKNDFADILNSIDTFLYFGSRKKM